MYVCLTEEILLEEPQRDKYSGLYFIVDIVSNIINSILEEQRTLLKKTRREYVWSCSEDRKIKEKIGKKR